MQWLSWGIGKIQRIMRSPKQCYLRAHWMGEKMPWQLSLLLFWAFVYLSWEGGERESSSFFLLEFVLSLNFLCKILLARTFFLKTSRIKHKSQYRVKETVKNTFGGKNYKILILAQTRTLWFEASELGSLSLSFGPASGRGVYCNKAYLPGWSWAQNITEYIKRTAQKLTCSGRLRTTRVNVYWGFLYQLYHHLGLT